MKKAEKVTKKEVTKEEKEQEEFQAKLQKVAQQIEAILIKNELALQPHMIRTDMGTFPRVRLVKVPTENEEKSD